jgi:hypothetical protein
LTARRPINYYTGKPSEKGQLYFTFREERRAARVADEVIPDTYIRPAITVTPTADLLVS